MLNYINNRFKYQLDPLFLASSAVYAVNRLGFLSPRILGYEFTNFYLNDALLAPVVLPVILTLSRILKLRPDTSAPKLVEIAIPLTIWSLAFELVGPFVFQKGTPDPLDVLAYCAGGLVCWLVWNR